MKTLSIALLTAAALVSSTLAGQPHMESALAHLEAAKAELKKAETNKGGWRVQAIKTINEAIVQIKAGESSAR